MTIAIDIDDTLVNTFEYLMPYTAAWCNKELSYLDQHDISYDNTPPEWGLVMKDFASTYFDSLIPFTPKKEGVSEITHLLHTMGHRIIIITHRNNTLYKDCYKTTREELKNIDVYYDDLFCTEDKTKICLREGVELLIDDTVSNCIAASLSGIETLVFSSRANRDEIAPSKRVNSWQEILEYIKGIK